MGAEGCLGAPELWKQWGGLGSLEGTHRLLSGCSEWGVVVCISGNSSGFVWVLLGQKRMSGGTGLARAIGDSGLGENWICFCAWIYRVLGVGSEEMLVRSGGARGVGEVLVCWGVRWSSLGSRDWGKDAGFAWFWVSFG